METHNKNPTNLDLYFRLGIKNPCEEPQILSIIANILEKNIQKNEKMLKKSRKKEKVTIFHGTKAPTLNIREYMSRVFKYSKCSASCLVVAYIYMDLFIQQTSCYVTSLDVHRIFVTCLLLGVKFLEDECFNNSYFAKIGGVSCAEMNKLELKLLSTLNYRLHVTLETFDQYCVHLEEEGATCPCPSSRLRWSVQPCGLTRSWLKKDRPRHDTKCDAYPCTCI
ncbi:hypothetical protein RND81_01G118200 [Saponaria officinalis]|uniref:Cyclin n=1 Tax=Saponaria officinalis TaxID=3572 RepID=A0AAW1NDQ0_SAPOF